MTPPERLRNVEFFYWHINKSDVTSDVYNNLNINVINMYYASLFVTLWYILVEMRNKEMYD